MSSAGTELTLIIAEIIMMIAIAALGGLLIAHGFDLRRQIQTRKLWRMAESPGPFRPMMKSASFSLKLLVIPILTAGLFTGCQPVASPQAGDQAADSTASEGAAPQSLTVYSGRSENLVAPLIEQFAEASGIDVEVRYGGTAEMAATIMEEGANSPADVFFGQDAGALGALAKAGCFTPLSASILEQSPTSLQSENGDWVGISGRARVLIYNTDQLTEDDLPDDIWGLTEETWRGRVGWAPTNGSFQAFVTALRTLEGEERAQQWLEAMIANDVQVYPNNSTIGVATGAGEISVGLVNHYYLYRFLAEEGEDFAARNHDFRTPGAGSMINVAGVGILDTAENTDAASAFVEFLLSPAAQEYFATETNEYPLAIDDVETPAALTPLADIAAPDLDLSDLDDLQGTLTLLQEVGALD